MQVTTSTPENTYENEFEISLVGMSANEYESMRKFLLTFFEFDKISEANIEELKLNTLNGIMLGQLFSSQA